MSNVLHILEAGSTGLISVDQLSLKRIDVWLKRESAEVYKDGILVAIAKKVNQLYRIISEGNRHKEGLLISLTDPAPKTLWHYWLGHLHHQAVLKMSSNKLVCGLPELQANTAVNWCTACLEGKMICTSFKPSEQWPTGPTWTDTLWSIWTYAAKINRRLFLFYDTDRRFYEIHSGVFFEKEEWGSWLFSSLQDSCREATSREWQELCHQRCENSAVVSPVLVPLDDEILIQDGTPEPENIPITSCRPQGQLRKKKGLG